MGRKKQAKCRNLMYTQQIGHLPLETVDNLRTEIETKLKPKKFAIITHDKDLDGQGSPEADHVHAMMTFENARSCASVAKTLNDRPQYVEVWNGNGANGYAYLVHATRNAAGKHRYDPEEVIANFDYPAELKKITGEVAKARRMPDVPSLLDAIYDGLITKEDAEERLTGSQMARYRRQIEDVWAKYLQKKAKKFLEEMRRQGKRLTVIWIYGAAGTGKTSLAKKFAGKDADRPYYMSGSSRDIFQNYAGEHILILDEFRPNVIPYPDLLRITDPFGSQVMAPSRYNDKALACDTVIITSPYDPQTFYDETFNFTGLQQDLKTKKMIDSFRQLLRRLTLVIEMDGQWISAVKYDEKHFSFVSAGPDTRRKNTYSSSSRPPEPDTADRSGLFNTMFGGGGTDEM